MTREEMDRMMDEHFGYEHADDVEGVMSTLADGAEHDIVGWPEGPQSSREGIQRFYETMFKDLDGRKTTTLRRLYGEDFLVDESLWEGTAPGRPFGFEGKGRPLSFRLLHVLRFAGDGRIAFEQVWVDLAAIGQQLG